MWSSSTGPGGAHRLFAALAILVGCRQPAPTPPPDFPPELAQQHDTRESPSSEAGRSAGPQVDRTTMERFHTQWHFNDLRTIERMLIDGDLEEAKARAFLLTKPEHVLGLAHWQPAAARVASAALALSHASSLAEAYRREPRVSATCARCHIATQRIPVFPPPPPPPPDSTSQETRMARHQWAADRLWESLVGDSERTWRIALAALAETSPPGDRPDLAKRLQTLATRRQTGQQTTLDQRAIIYGELLATCGACHSAIARSGR